MTLKGGSQPPVTGLSQVAQAPAFTALETAPPKVEAAGDGVLRLSGYWTSDHSQAVEDAVQAQAARLIDSAEQGAGLALQLLVAPGELLQMRNAAEQFCHLHRGATARTLETLERERLTLQ